MNAEIENIRDKKLSEFGKIGDEEKPRFGTKIEATSHEEPAEPHEQAVPNEIASEAYNEPAPEPQIEQTVVTEEVAPQEVPSEEPSIKDDPYEEGAFAGAPAISNQGSAKKKLLMIIIVAIAFFAGAYFTFLSGDEKTAEVVELDDLPALPAPLAPTPDYIDNGESHNQFMQQNAEAKENNVSIFNFDINQCLQRFSDDECMNMYEDSLKIEENRSPTIRN